MDTFFKDLLGIPNAAFNCCTTSRPPDSMEANTKSLCGVGIIFREKENPTYNDCNCTVAALSAGGPAENSKQICAGDILFKVDGKSVVGLRLQDLGSLLLGPVGSAVALEFIRGPAWRDGQGKTFSVDLQRRWNTVGLKSGPM
uniref:PDZ domain-containing protein n=1 Tax=Cryptomonas curvata TaxID=233186 RepID=A0A7S0N8G1_9CRYP|mmetsp:Transcript_7918/g.16878  ORF Transcript_7918/g.16878 Transcript_7918/m.16878 type:complete len:143 (+) Transcript_7918:55-483(+)